MTVVAGFAIENGRVGLRLSSAADFLAVERPPLSPLVATPDDRTVLLAASTTLLIAGPSGVGKSLVAFDLGGRLAREKGSLWLGLRVAGGQRVLLLPFEGSDADTAERTAQLVPKDARSRFLLLDRWRGPALPRSDKSGIRVLADTVRDAAIDVVLVDTGSAFFGGAGGHDISRGIPEEAADALDEIRACSGRPLAVVVIAHTRKLDRGGTKVDELEEVSGTFPRKADSVVVIRREGEDGSRRRSVKFAKVRRGPDLRTVIAALPEDPDAPPRLEVVAGESAGRRIKEGTRAKDIADWVAGQPGPVAVRVLCARFDLPNSTLRRRRDELAALGVEHHKLVGRGNTWAYATTDQWRTATLGEAA